MASSSSPPKQNDEYYAFTVPSFSSSHQHGEDRSAFSGIEPPFKRKKVSESSRLYDVFINHRGPDVKNTLALELYKSLEKLRIVAFLDSEEKELGNSFTSTIETAIRSAPVHIAIFSKRYAESPWCLAELVLMLQTKAKIIPLFYGVKPSDLRFVEKGEYARAFVEYEKKKRYTEKLSEWKEALQSVSFIAGEELNRDCEKIVSTVQREVQRMRCLHVAKYPVGLSKLVEHFEEHCIDKLVQDFESLCKMNKQREGKAKIVGIFGMGGVGKTTLCKELFNRKRLDYSRSCFLFDVREASVKKDLPSLQLKLLRELFDEKDNQSFASIEDGTSCLSNCFARSSNLSFLIVLDDIDHQEQLDAFLISDELNNCRNSLVIVTTRDVGVLINAGITVGYNLKGMDANDAKELFCFHAFSQSYPSSGYEELVDSFVHVCGGLPLSLQVLGRHVHGQDQKFWELELKKATKTLPQDIHKRLRISIETLDNEEKQIFMDVACFFIGELKKDAIRVWEGSGWSAQHALRKLKNKCLVEEIEDQKFRGSREENFELRMHDHLRDLGREMADELSHPRRLWRSQHLQSLISKGFENILTQAKVRCLHSFRDPSTDFFIKYFLGESDNMAETSTALLWLEMSLSGNTVTKIPPWIPFQNLQSLSITGGSLERLWQNNEQAPIALKELRISSISELKELSLGLLSCLEKFTIDKCWHLKSMTGITDLTKLVELNISKCEELEQLSLVRHSCLEKIRIFNSLNLQSVTVSHLQKLIELNISGCEKIEELILVQLNCLEKIKISDCSDLKSVEGISNLRKLVKLQIEKCPKLEEISFVQLSFLQNITISNCQMLKSLKGINDLPKLVELNISKCEELEQLSLVRHSCLEKIRIFNSLNLQSVTVSHLQKLIELNISGCEKIEELILVQLNCLEKIKISDCSDLKSVEGISNLRKLEQLQIERCPKLEEISFVQLSFLQNITISNCQMLKSLKGINDLPKLVELNISKCEELKEFSSLVRHSCIEKLSISNSLNLQSVTISHLKKLVELNISGCEKMKELNIVQLSRLEKIKISDCPGLKSVLGLYGLKKVVELQIEKCPKLEGVIFVQLSFLENMTVFDCQKLKSLKGLNGLRKLVELNISECEELEELNLVGHGCLKKLRIFNSLNLQSVTVSHLQKLIELNISGCQKIEELSLVQLNCLKKIRISDCPYLKSVAGMSDLRKLVELNINECGELEELSLVRLRCLQKITISGDLQSVTVSHLMNLVELKLINYVNIKELSLVQLSRLRRIEILGSLTVKIIEVKGCKILSRADFENLKNVVKLSICDCPELENLPELVNLHQLKIASLNNCPKLKKITLPTTLIKFTLQCCRELQTVAGIYDCTDVEELVISKCPELELDELSFARLCWLKKIAIDSCGKLQKITGIEKLLSLERMQLLYCNHETVRNCILKMEKLPSDFIQVVGRAVDGAESNLIASFFCTKYISTNSVIQISTDQICPDDLVSAIIICAVVVVNTCCAANMINDFIGGCDWNPWLKFEVRQGEWLITSVTTNQDQIHNYILNRGYCFPFDYVFTDRAVTKDVIVRKGYNVTLPVRRGEGDKALIVLRRIIEKLYEK
ncbi:hypothetical protein SUGI_0675960 [Cryptomeria japonica]|uniref:disease resistance protein Roq1 isoform X2 n=1 Tax=Cryptomeria japonica TaxID=3369 RepID=UPI0024148366|nr:disease resistance protein Roq1 isoform X2 [Cryptomeria japonica]GLJ33626.1 hypothetical protein SUGI_0675960 [Cryptomeria japonica]